MSEAIARTLLPTVRRAYEKLLHHKTLDVPTEISWRSARILVGRDVATLNPFERRWLGRLTLKEPT